MRLNADLHIHSFFSIGTSRNMDLSHLVLACRIKGLQVLGSGDALHPVWREHCARHQEDDPDLLLVPTAEVEDERRVHHLLLMEDFERFAHLAEDLEGAGRNIATAGRPRVNLSGEELAGRVHRHGGLIGPAHAFTPYTSLYARYASLGECYGKERIDFLELGLSADSSYGNAISELSTVPFLSNSDAHGPETIRIGREWNCLEVAEPTVRGVLQSIREGTIVYNAGFFPEEGKYNRTACSRCYQQYTRRKAEITGWRCPVCGGRIQLGVRDRAEELSDREGPDRPPYHHVIPLGEIVQRVLGTSSPRTRRCRDLYHRLVTILGPEIGILREIPLEEITAVHAGVGEAVGALRRGEVRLSPGGGGQYGTFSLGRK